MIGIIGKEIDVYSIIDKVHNVFPKVMIYYCPGESNDGSVEELIIRGCKIIIVGDNTVYQGKYPDCRFISFDETIEKDEIGLLKAIDNGDEDGVRKILSNVKIYDNTIILHHPKLLFIKHIIEEIFPGIIIKSSIDSLIDEILKYESLLEVVDNAEVKVIVRNYNED